MAIGAGIAVAKWCSHKAHHLTNCLVTAIPGSPDCHCKPKMFGITGSRERQESQIRSARMLGGWMCRPGKAWQSWCQLHTSHRSQGRIGGGYMWTRVCNHVCCEWEKKWEQPYQSTLQSSLLASTLTLPAEVINVITWPHLVLRWLELQGSVISFFFQCCYNFK